MVPSDAKATLHRALQVAREAVLWKLEGLPGEQVRRPMVRTGTNLLGLVKHLAGVEAGYLGEVFDRPFPEPMPWMSSDAPPNADLWATDEEPRAEVVALYQRVWTHADATVAALDLDAPGHVPWWGSAGDVTLHQVLVHLVAETHRHAGHADVLRELLDGAAGVRAGNDNLPAVDAAWWEDHRTRLEEVAAVPGRGMTPPTSPRPTTTSAPYPEGAGQERRCPSRSRPAPPPAPPPSAPCARPGSPTAA